MLHILITGGLGFIGTNLSLYYLKLGHKVYCIDNEMTCNLNNKSILNIYPNWTYIHQDIITPITYNFEHLDYIFNLACPASPSCYQHDPIHTLKTNTIGLYNIIDIALKYGFKPSHEVKLDMRSGKQTSFNATATHPGGTKIYTVDNKGEISTNKKRI